MWSAERPRYRGFLERRRQLPLSAVSITKKTLSNLEIYQLNCRLASAETPSPAAHIFRKSLRVEKSRGAKWRNVAPFLACQETAAPFHSLVGGGRDFRTGDIPDSTADSPRRRHSQRHRLFSKISREWIN